MLKLKKDECLISAGEAVIREPGEKTTYRIPQYVIVKKSSVPAARIVPVEDNEAIIHIGTQTKPGGKQRAYELFEAARKNGEIPRLSSIPDTIENLYIKVDKSEVSTKTQLTEREELACREIVKAMAEQFKNASRT